MRRERGFSLLEVLLAAALGVVMTTAVVQLFVGSSKANALLGGQARLQESMRHAIALVSRSARSAGYFGCAATDQLVNGLNGEWRQIVEFDVSVPVEGFDGRQGSWMPSLGTLPARGGGSGLAFVGRNRIDPGRLRPGSDVVVFRRVEAPGRPIARRAATGGHPQTSAAGDPIVVVDDEGPALGADDFVVVSDCHQAALFRIGSIDSVGGATTLTRAGQPGAFGNRANQLLSANGRPYGGELGPEAAAVARVVTEIYFVARGVGLDSRNQVVWSLWRKTGAARPMELVQGIEDLQVLFGVDLNSDDGMDVLTRYVNPSEVADGRVLAIRFFATVSSGDVADDGVPRLTVPWTIALRNP